MNQIICTSNSNISIVTEYHKKSNIFRILFYFLTTICFSTFLYYLYFRYSLYSSEKISKELLNNFNITSIYSSNSDYTANLVSKNLNLAESSNYSVIGILEIKKINITYPILSEINKNFLKISPCRFYGPYPNEIGNLCIAAHNYKNGTFFSNLSDLKNGDIITIYDSNNSSVDYVVYKVYTSSASNLECINQNTNNLKEITLITCNSLDNNYRTIVKAKEF